VDAHGHAHPQEDIRDMRINQPSQHDVAGGGDAHAPGEYAPAFHVPSEPHGDELPEHVGDEIDGPRPGDLDVVEAELVLQRMLDDRIDLAREVEAAIREPGRREELHAIAAQQDGGIFHTHVNDRPQVLAPSASGPRIRRQGGSACSGPHATPPVCRSAAGDEDERMPAVRRQRQAVLEHDRSAGRAESMRTE
jgi:hypothetical protein